MSIRQDLKSRGRMVRNISVGNDLNLQITNFMGSWRGIAITDPDIEVAGSEESPRFAPAYIVGWPIGYKGFEQTLEPGARIETAKHGTMELLSPPRQLKEHNFDLGWTALCNTLDFLYPVAGILQSQGGIAIENMILALWDVKEDQERTSRYKNMDAECPIDHQLEVNQQISIDGVIWKITEVRTHYTGPRRQFSVRAQA